MKRFFPVVILLFGAAVFGQGGNVCQSGFVKMVQNRYQCIQLFKEAADPSKQPREGILNLTENRSLDSCLGRETRNFSSKISQSCLYNYLPDDWKSFDSISKSCINRYNLASCSTKVNNFCRKGKKIDFIRDLAGATLLMRAAEALDTTAFNLFLQKGANIHAVDLNGQNVLMYALRPTYQGDENSESLKTYNNELRKKQLVLVKKILALGVSPNELDLYGKNALFYALFVPGIESVVDELLRAKANTALSVDLPRFSEERNRSGANSQVRSNFFEALHLARLNRDSLRIWHSPYFKKVWMATENWGTQFELYSVASTPSGGRPFDLLASLRISNLLEETSYDELVATALRRGVSPNLVDEDSTSYFIIFMANSSYSTKKALQAFWDAKVALDSLKERGKKSGPGLLMKLAIEQSNQLLVQKLLSRKYDLDLKVSHRMYCHKYISGTDTTCSRISLNALEYAVDCGEKEIVKMLVKAKAKVRESYALGIAVIKNDVEMAKYLIGLKANVNDMLPDGMTAFRLTLLEYAERMEGFDDMKKLLKKAGAVKPFQSNFVQFCLDSSLTVSDLLGAIQKGADVNEVDENGWTPLHSIAQMGKDAKLVDLLVKKGAFVNATTSGGVSPFLTAVSNANPAILKALVKAGADISITLNGWDALCYAVANNSNPAVVATLLQMGLDENYSNRDKNTLVIIAVKNNPNEKILIQLFKSGYKANPEDSWWNSPLEVALENQKDVKIIKTLLQAHAKVTDRARSIVNNWEVGKYRNQVMDMLIKAKK